MLCMQLQCRSLWWQIVHMEWQEEGQVEASAEAHKAVAVLLHRLLPEHDVIEAQIGVCQKCWHWWQQRESYIWRNWTFPMDGS
jgi:hypothetical protein